MDMNIITPNAITRNIMDLKPRDIHYIIFMAAPVSHDSASSYSGLCE